MKVERQEFGKEYSKIKKEIFEWIVGKDIPLDIFNLRVGEVVFDLMDGMEEREKNNISKKIVSLDMSEHIDVSRYDFLELFVDICVRMEEEKLANVFLKKYFHKFSEYCKGIVGSDNPIEKIMDMQNNNDVYYFLDFLSSYKKAVVLFMNIHPDFESSDDYNTYISFIDVVYYILDREKTEEAVEECIFFIEKIVDFNNNIINFYLST